MKRKIMPATTLIGVIFLVSFVCVVLILVDNIGESSKTEGTLPNLPKTAPAIPATKAVPQPPEADYLTEIGLETNAYKNRDGDEWTCFSPYQELGSGFPLPNNLAYYLSGDKAGNISMMKVVLNVNDLSREAEAKNALLNACRMLYQKAMRASLTEAVERAILQGAPGARPVDSWMLSITREDWASGKGYDLGFILQRQPFCEL